MMMEMGAFPTGNLKLKLLPIYILDRKKFSSYSSKISRD